MQLAFESLGLAHLAALSMACASQRLYCHAGLYISVNSAST